MAASAKDGPLSGFASGLGLPLSWSPGWVTEFQPSFSPGVFEPRPKEKEQEKEAGG